MPAPPDLIAKRSQQSGQAGARSNQDAARCCGAATGPGRIRARPNNRNRINTLSGYDAILTWSDAVSMVRAAFKGDGASFPSTATSFRVSTSWRAARTRTGTGNATYRRPTKLRFPQGSEVWIAGCPTFGTAARSGLTYPKAEAETVLPEPRRWRAVSGFLRSWSRVLPSEQ